MNNGCGVHLTAIAGTQLYRTGSIWLQRERKRREGERESIRERHIDRDRENARE